MSECISRWSPSQPDGRQARQPAEQLVVDARLVGGEPAVALPDRGEAPHHPAVHDLVVAEAPHAEGDDLVVAEHGSYGAAGGRGLVDETAYERDDAEPVGAAVEEVAEDPQPGVAAGPVRLLVDRARTRRRAAVSSDRWPWGSLVAKRALTVRPYDASGGG